MKINIMNNIKAIIMGIIIVLGVQYVSATFGPWTAPPSPPPSNNVAAPINVGDFTQTKVAGITLDATTDDATLTTEKLIVTSPGMPAVAGQVLTAVNATGLVKWGTPTGGSGTGGSIIINSLSMLTANLVLLSDVKINESGTHAAPYSVTVNGASVGDSVIVSLVSKYSYDQVNAICAAPTATVSSINTVKVHFWNSYGSTDCTIPFGTYFIKVLKSESSTQPTWKQAAPGCNGVITTNNKCVTPAADGCTGSGCVSTYWNCAGTVSGAGRKICTNVLITNACIANKSCDWNEIVYDNKVKVLD